MDDIFNCRSVIILWDKFFGRLDRVSRRMQNVTLSTDHDGVLILHGHRFSYASSAPECVYFRLRRKI